MEWHEWDRAAKKLSRDGKWQFRAGMVLKSKDGREHLVGDVNRALGLCACCTELWKDDDTIVAWAWADAEFLAALRERPEEE